MAGKKRTVTRKSAEAKPESAPTPKRAPTKTKRASARAGQASSAGVSAAAGANAESTAATIVPVVKAPSKAKAKAPTSNNGKTETAHSNGAKSSTRAARRVSPSIAPTLTEETEFRENGSAVAPYVPPPPHEAIAVEAYFIWQAQGCPWGQDRQHWFMAESRLRLRS